MNDERRPKAAPEPTTKTATSRVADLADNPPDNNVVPFRGLGYAEYQEARRQLGERNARARGGG